MSHANPDRQQPSVRRHLVGGIVVNLVANVFLYLGHLIIARGLSREDYAVFTVTVSFISLLALFADLGLTLLFVRKFAEADEAARQGANDRRGELLGSILTLRIILSLGVSAFVWFAAPLLGYPGTTVHLMRIMLLTLFISSRLMVVRSVGEAYLRGHNRYYQVAIFALVDAAVFAIALFAFYKPTLSLESAVWIYSLCHLPGFILLVVTIARHAREFRFRLSARFDQVFSMVREGLPLILSTTFLTIHNFADALLLDRLSTPQEVSAFGAGLRVLTAVIFLPSVFSAVIGPRVTQAVVRKDHEHVRGMVAQAIALLLVTSLSIAMVLQAAPLTIVRVLFGGAKYADAASIIVIFGWAIVPIAIATFLTEIAIAEGALWISTMYMATIMVISVGLDIVLIPTYGALGTAIAKAVAVSVGTVALVYRSRLLGVVRASDLWSLLGRCAVAVVAAVVGMWLMHTYAFSSEIVTAAVSLTVFLLGIVVLQVIPTDELRRLLQPLRSR
ncbi:MAG: flippase [Bacteroidetes bacterium]|nr:flippase [Bacteroidota bacterium]